MEMDKNNISTHMFSRWEHKKNLFNYAALVTHEFWMMQLGSISLRKSEKTGVSQSMDIKSDEIT